MLENILDKIITHENILDCSGHPLLADGITTFDVNSFLSFFSFYFIIILMFFLVEKKDKQNYKNNTLK